MYLNKSVKYLLLLTVLIMTLTGCDKNPGEPEYVKEITIFGYLWGEQYLTQEHAIMITWSQPITTYYDQEKAVIRNAKVTLTDLDHGSVYPLTENDARPGFYYNDSLMIQPKTQYQLKIEKDGKVATATTLVPPPLKITTQLSTEAVNNTKPGNSSREKPIFLECENPDQIILVDMYCNETWENAEYVTKFFGQERPESEDEYSEGGTNGEPRHIMGYGKYETFTSDTYPGQFVVDWYASMIVFYGSYTMQVLAIDANYSSYITTNEYPEYRSGVQGGIGVFGSITGSVYELMVVRE